MQPPSVHIGSIDPSLGSLIQSSRTAVAQSPQSATAWGRLGQALHAAEFNHDAIVCYSNAARLDQRDPRWPYLLGTLELQDLPGAALQHLARATDLARGKTDAPRFALARAEVERGELAQAQAHLELVVRDNPGHAAARVEMARIYMTQGRLKEATAQLQWALTNQFTMRQAMLLAAQIAQRNNQADVAAQISARALSIPRSYDWPDPYLKEVQSLRKDRERMADQVNALLQQQHLPEAEAALTKLLASFPEDPEGLLLLGRLRYQQKNCHEAETVLRRHLALQPNSLNGLVQLGIALLCEQKWSNALPVFERAVELKPDFAAAHHNLAVARSHAGDAAGAIRAYREAVRCSPGDVNALFALAEECANGGELREAIECVKRAEAISPRDPRIPRAKQQLGLK